METPLFVPMLLGTSRKHRASENVARFVFGEVRKRPELTTELIDVRQLALSTREDEGETIKDPIFSAAMQRADALIIVLPEYNHGYPGLLKDTLDTNLKEYVHKAVGLCGVSAGIFGGARAIENILPVLRELGLMTTFTDVNFGNAQTLFDAEGHITDTAYVGRTAKFLDELVWMAKTLRYGRENFPQA